MAGTWKLLRSLQDGVICCKFYKDWDSDPSTPEAWISRVGSTHEMVDDPDGSVMQKHVHRQVFDSETGEPGPLIENWKIVDGIWEAIP